MKRIVTYLGCLVFSLPLIWGGMFGADCCRTLQLQRPLFALCHMTAMVIRQFANWRIQI